MGVGCHLERIVDLMAHICTMVGIPDTFGDMAMKQMESLPKGCRRYNVVADVYYTDRFFKTAERIQRGVGEKYIVKGSNTKIPIKFYQFLTNGMNKERLIDMIRDVWIDNSNKLSTGQQIYFSKKGEMLSHHKRT